MHDMRFARSKEVEYLFVSPDASILDALDVIDKGGRKTAIVVDEDKRLLGVIADPDIRRALLNNISLKDPVRNVMNANPITLQAGVSKLEARQRLHHHKRDVLPVLDKDRQVIDVALLLDTLEPKKCDNTVILMAGGMGKRLLPLTEQTPKPMLKVGSKPILETLIESFVAAGFSKFYISINYLQHAIEEYFGDGAEWGVEIAYLRESSALGTAGALSLLESIPTKPFITMNCDVLTKVDFESLLKHHDTANTRGTMCVSQHEVSIPFGVVEHDNFELKRIVEKPSWNYFVNAGVYVFSPQVLGLLDKNKALDMPELIARIDKTYGKVSLFPIREYWLDVGNHTALKQAKEDYDIHFSQNE